jgi:hypothetical protein
MKFDEWCEKAQFKSTPTLYFSPQELDKDVGDYPFIVKFISADIKKKKKVIKVIRPDKTEDSNAETKKPKRKTKPLWTMEVEVITDKRKNTKSSPIRPGRYLWDLSFENMGLLRELKARVDIYSVPLLFTHKRFYKGKHPFSQYEFNEVETGSEKTVPEPLSLQAAALPPAPATVPKAISSNPIASSISKVPAARPSRPLTEHGTPLRSSGILYDEYGEIADDCGDNWWKALKDDDVKALGKWERDEKAKATSREQQMELEAISQTIKATWKATGVLQLPGVAGEVKAATAQEQKSTGPKAIEQAGKEPMPSIEPSQNSAMKAQGGEVKKAKSSDVGSIFIWEDDK